MQAATFLALAITVALALLVTAAAAPDNDRDKMIGQVPAKKSPVNAFNNVKFAPFDFAQGKGCEGENCQSTSDQQYRRQADMYWGDPENSAELDICDLPRDYGDCSHRMIRWYFDGRDGFCRRFIYSGCTGNANNFQDRHSCQQQCMAYYYQGGSTGRRDYRSGNLQSSRRQSTRGGGGWGDEEEDDSDDGDEEQVETKTKTKSSSSNSKSKTSSKKGSASKVKGGAGKVKGGSGKRTVYKKTVTEEDADE